MCGINGIAFGPNSGRQVNERILASMRHVLNHRGPDDGGIWIDGNIGLGHRRLSIVDVEHGAQPMHFLPSASLLYTQAGSLRSDTLTIVYNGEIYNHAECRPSLVERGHSFETHCDTETILHLYAEYGRGCVEHMRGMFAFAIWDGGKKELFLARDRFGVKPLYYVHTQDGSLYFASEIKALIESGAVKAEINYNALPDQFANHGTSGDETLFAGVKRLLPGHTLVWRDGKIDIREYWDLEFEPKHEPRSDREYIDEWRELFEESVRLRLMADVPLGMFLSGGIDSSAIAAIMATMVDEPIKTFSVAFNEREANELEYARLVARKFKTDHHEIVVTSKQFFETLPKLVWHEDEPLGFIASVPLYFVSKLAQQHVKVVLTGEGSDETLAGYGRYAKALKLLEMGERYEAMAPSFLRDAVRGGVASLPRVMSSKLNRTFLTRESDIENLFFDNFAVFPRAMQRKMFAHETYERLENENPYAAANDLLSRSDAEDTLDKLLYADTKTYLHELLMKQDQMSMAASIESRVPFLDHKLVEFTARMPREMKLRGGTTKWILREAMKAILPPEIIDRPKMGFPVPVGKWLRGDYKHIVDEYVLSERAVSRGTFDPSFLRQLVAEHNSGVNHDERLWSLVNFEIWQRTFIDGETEVNASERRLPACVSPTVETSKTSFKAKTQASSLRSDSVLRGRDIVCFSHDWTGDPLSKTHLMRVLSRENRVLWVNSIANRMPTASSKDVSRIFKKLSGFAEPIREVEPNIFVLNPLAVPAYGSDAIVDLNRRFLTRQVRSAMGKLGFSDVVNIVFNPAAGMIAGKLGERELIYYCVDEYTAFTGATDGLKKIEDELFRKADLVVVSAERLFESKKHLNPNTHIIRHGTDWEHFRKALDSATVIPSEIADLPRPIVGFHGLLADWIDYELIKQVAGHFSHGSVVLIGKTNVDAEQKIKTLDGVPNIHILGRKPYSELPAYCKGFDVALNPFAINELTLAANPLKVREYLAAGLPVVSTDIPEVRILDDVLVGVDRADFILKIEAALANPEARETVSDRIREESWESKVEELRDLLRRSAG